MKNNITKLYKTFFVLYAEKCIDFFFIEKYILINKHDKHAKKNYIKIKLLLK